MNTAHSKNTSLLLRCLVALHSSTRKFCFTSIPLTCFGLQSMVSKGPTMRNGLDDIKYLDSKRRRRSKITVLFGKRSKFDAGKNLGRNVNYSCSSRFQHCQFVDQWDSSSKMQQGYFKPHCLECSNAVYVD